jgi:hypothetical protein
MPTPTYGYERESRNKKQRKALGYYRTARKNEKTKQIKNKKSKL